MEPAIYTAEDGRARSSSDSISVPDPGHERSGNTGWKKSSFGLQSFRQCREIQPVSESLGPSFGGGGVAGGRNGRERRIISMACARGYAQSARFASDFITCG